MADMTLEEALRRRRGRSRLADIAEQYGFPVYRWSPDCKIAGVDSKIIIIDEQPLPTPPQEG